MTTLNTGKKFSSQNKNAVNAEGFAKSIYRKLFGTTLVLGTLLAGSAFASGIEGGTSDAIASNDAVLKSVVNIQAIDLADGGIISCSASLVSENILLTARHCVEDPETHEEVYKKGSPIILNGMVNFEVSAVMKTPAMAEADPKGGAPFSRDVALILVKQIDPHGSKLNLPVLPIAQKGERKLNKKMLLAGYGLTDLASDAPDGKLHAGYNTALTEEEMQNSRPFAKVGMFSSLAPVGKKFNMYQGMLAFTGARIHATVFSSKKGQEVNLSKASYGKAVANDSGIGLPGDSGGPVIGFDSENKAYVAGIASTTQANLLDADIPYAIVDKDQRVVASFIIPRPVDMGVVDDILKHDFSVRASKALENSGLISVMGIATQDFSIQILKPKQAGCYYVSVSEEPNASFIQESLKKLEAIRATDAMGESSGLVMK